MYTLIMFDLGELFSFGRKWGVVVVTGLIGLSLAGYGVWEGVRGESFDVAQEKSVVEIVGDEGEYMDSPVLVDVGGAVESPGVYKLPEKSRIGEAITAAGGLSEQADKEWVTKYLNLAEEVKDGGKIFVPPKADENAGTSNIEHSNIGGGKININTASVSELDSLWGVGESRAQAIIDNRPYGSVEELVDKAKIPSNVFESIKDEVSVY